MEAEAKRYQQSQRSVASGGRYLSHAVKNSPEVALTYLQSLTDDSLREAKRYIDNAPAAVSTPLRRLLQETD